MKKTISILISVLLILFAVFIFSDGNKPTVVFGENLPVNATDLESLGITAEIPEQDLISLNLESVDLPVNLTPVEQEIIGHVLGNANFKISKDSPVSPQIWTQTFYNILIKLGDSYEAMMRDNPNGQVDLYARLKTKL